MTIRTQYYGTLDIVAPEVVNKKFDILVDTIDGVEEDEMYDIYQLTEGYMVAIPLQVIGGSIL